MKRNSSMRCLGLARVLADVQVPVPSWQPTADTMLSSIVRMILRWKIFIGSGHSF